MKKLFYIILIFAVIFTALCYSSYKNSISEKTSSKINTTSDGNILKLMNPENEIGSLSSKYVKKIHKDMTYREIILTLGKTKEVGSGLYILVYNVDNDKQIHISFANLNDKCSMSGEEILKNNIVSKNKEVK